MAMLNSPLSVALVGLLVYVTSSSGQPSLISTTPSNAVVKEGENLTIFCEISDPAFTIELEIDSVEVDADSNSRFTLLEPNQINNRSWIFHNVSRNDDGAIFTCFSQTVNERSEEVGLSVLFAPSISSLTSAVVPVGGSVNVTFTAVANPNVIVAGIKVTPLEPEDILKNGSNQFSLVYELQTGSNAGSQYLNVTNSVDSVVATFTLDVYGFANDGGNIQVNKSDPLRVDCSVVESSPGIVESVTVSGYGISGMMTLPSDNRIYEVAMVTLAYNGETFTCTASNGETMTQIMYTVTVNETPTSTSTTATSTTSSSSTTSTSTSPSPTTEPTIASAKKNSLSGGEIAGIVVGIVVFVIVLVVVAVIIAVVFFKMRSSSKA